MATITTSGATTGLDVNALVTQLVAAERAPQDTRLARVDSKLTTELSSLSQLKGAMSNFQSVLATLKDSAGYQARKATTGDNTRFSATASSAASPASYDVSVTQLARAQQLRSTVAFPAGSTAEVGTGTLTLAMGSSSIELTITSTNNTLAGIRDAINGATGNPGIRATLVAGVDGTRLVLSGTRTGLANAFTVAAAGGDGGLAAMTYAPGALTNGLTSIAAAQDAIVQISGIEARSATNTFDKAIDGVTMTVMKAEPGVTAPLAISNDDAAIQTRVNNFITAYNQLATQMSKLRSYDATSKAAGPMLGDSMLRNIETQLKRLLGSPSGAATGPYTTLASLGITSAVNGTLSLDAAKFHAAQAANPANVANVFGSATGVATQAHTFLGAHLAANGDIASRDANIAARRKDLDVRKAEHNARMQLIQTRYQKQFQALDAMLSNLQGTSTYLARQLSNSSS
jgi:flagellar hook-associated protein 2